MSSVAINRETGEIQVLSAAGAWEPAKRATNPQTGEEVFYDGGGWKPVPPKPRGMMEMVDGTVRQLARGATLGYADEIAAGANALPALLDSGRDFGTEYNANLATERATDRAFERDNPALAIGANLVGGIATPGGAIRGTGTLARMGSGAARGAGAGAVAGFGEGEGGLDQRLASAATGGAMGAGIGAALPPVASLIGAGSGRAASMLGLRNPERATQRQLIRALEQDAVPVQDLPQRLAQFNASGGPPAILADLGGAATLGTAEAATQMPGTAAQLAARVLEQRGGEAQAGLLRDTMRSRIGRGEDFTQTFEQLTDQRARAAAPLYDAAMQVPVDPSAVAPILARVPQGVIARARRLAQTEGQPFTVGDPANSAPSMQDLHRIKLALDDEISTGPMQGIGATERRGLTGLQADLVGVMGPEYAAARAAFAGPSQSRDALELGRTVLREDSDALAAQVQQLAPGDRDFFKVGVARAVQDKLDSMGDNRDLSRVNVFTSEKTRRLLRPAFDSDQEFNDFLGSLRSFDTAARTNAAINPRGGSPTARRQAFQESMQDDPNGPILDAVTRGMQTGGPFGAIGGAIRQMQARSSRMDVNTANALGPMLLNTDSAANEATIQALLGRQALDQASTDRNRALVAALLRGTSGATALGAN